MVNQDSLWVDSKGTHSGTQGPFLCGPQSILKVLIKSEKTLMRGVCVQLLEGEERRGLGLPWPPCESEH